MNKVFGSGFGVRFYRRPMPRSNVKPAFDLKGIWKMATTVTIPLVETKPAIVNQESSGKEKEKALWQAARAGDCYKIRLLVMDGVDLDARDAQGRTAINIATQYNKTEAIKTLRAAKEMRYSASIGDLPDTKFFRKFSTARTGRGDER